MPKINLDQLKVKQELTINSLKIKIEEEICPPKSKEKQCTQAGVHHFKCRSSDNRVVYIIHFTKAYPVTHFRALQEEESMLRSDLANLKEGQKALLLINGDFPAKYTLFLPRHLETWLLGSVSDDVIFDTKSPKLKELGLPEPKRIVVDQQRDPNLTPNKKARTDTLEAANHAKAPKVLSVTTQAEKQIEPPLRNYEEREKQQAKKEKSKKLPAQIKVGKETIKTVRTEVTKVTTKIITVTTTMTTAKAISKVNPEKKPIQHKHINNLPNIEQQKIGTQRLKRWLELKGVIITEKDPTTVQNKVKLDTCSLDQKSNAEIKISNNIVDGRKREPLFKNITYASAATAAVMKASEDNLLATIKNFNGHLGMAIGGGDCFYDSVAQALEKIGIVIPVEAGMSNDKTPAYEKLRILCYAYANKHKNNPSHWLSLKTKEPDFEKDYFEQVRYTANHFEQIMKDELDILDEGPEKRTSPIWGKADLDGRILCEILGIQIHVLEAHNSSEDLPTVEQLITLEKVVSLAVSRLSELTQNPKLVHIAVTAGDLHYAPVFKPHLPVLSNQNVLSGYVAVPQAVLSHTSDKDEKQRTEMQATVGENIDDNMLKSIAQTVEPHQLRAYQQYYQNGRLLGINNAVLQFPTGAGKTFWFGQLSIITGEKTLVLVPYVDLLKQTMESIRRSTQGSNFKLSIGILGEDSKSARTPETMRKFFEKHHIVVATYQLIKLNRMDNYLPYDLISLLILDEAHQSLTTIMQNFIKNVKNKNIGVIAATATPRIGKKADGLDNVYRFLGFNDPVLDLKQPNSSSHNNPIQPYTLLNAIDDEVCAPVVTTLLIPNDAKKIVFKHKNKEGRIVDTGKISEEDAARVIDEVKYNNIIVNEYMNGRDTYFKDSLAGREEIKGKAFLGEQAIVFCGSISHATNMAVAFNAISVEQVDKNGVLRQIYAENIYQQNKRLAQKKYEEKGMQNGKLTLRGFAYTDEQEKNARAVALKEAHQEFCIAKTIHSKASKSECSAILEQYKMGGILVLTGLTKLSEGFDHPKASLVFLTTTIGSERTLLQMSGRGGRKIRADGKAQSDKIWRVFNMVWPTLKSNNEKYFFLQLSEQGILNPKFTRGDKRIAEIRAAYLLNCKDKNELERIPVGTDVNSKPAYSIKTEPNQEVIEILQLKVKRAQSKKESAVNTKPRSKSISHPNLNKVEVQKYMVYIQHAAEQINQILKKFGNIQTLEVAAIDLSTIPEALELPDRYNRKKSEVDTQDETMAEFLTDDMSEELSGLDAAQQQLKKIKDIFAKKPSKHTPISEGRPELKQRNSGQHRNQFFEKLNLLTKQYDTQLIALKTILSKAILSSSALVVVGATNKKIDVESIQKIIKEMSNIQGQFDNLTKELSLMSMQKDRENKFRNKTTLQSISVPRSLGFITKKSSATQKNKKNKLKESEISKIEKIKKLAAHTHISVLFISTFSRFKEGGQSIPRVDVLEEKLRLNPDELYVLDAGKNNLLHLACLQNDAESILYLVNRDKKLLHAKNEEGDQPLHLLHSTYKFAIIKEADYVIDKSIEYALQQNRYRENILSLCAVLLENGADPNGANTAGKTPTWFAFTNGDISLAMLFKAFGGKIDEVSLTKYYHQIYDNSIDFLNLIKQPSDFTIQDKNNVGIVGRAVLHASVKTLEIVLKHNANYMLPNKEGNTPLHLAMRSRSEFNVKEYTFLKKFLQFAQTQNKLKEILESRNTMGQIPLHLMMSRIYDKKRIGGIQCLIHHLPGSEVIVDKNGNTPIHYLMTKMNNGQDIRLDYNFYPLINMVESIYKKHAVALDTIKNKDGHLALECYLNNVHGTILDAIHLLNAIKDRRKYKTMRYADLIIELYQTIIKRPFIIERLKQKQIADLKQATDTVIQAWENKLKEMGIKFKKRKSFVEEKCSKDHNLNEGRDIGMVESGIEASLKERVEQAAVIEEDEIDRLASQAVAAAVSSTLAASDFFDSIPENEDEVKLSHGDESGSKTSDTESSETDLEPLEKEGVEDSDSTMEDDVLPLQTEVTEVAKAAKPFTPGFVHSLQSIRTVNKDPAESTSKGYKL